MSALTDKINELHAVLDYSDYSYLMNSVQDLESRLIVNEKALEIACKHPKPNGQHCWHEYCERDERGLILRCCDEACNKAKKRYFKQQAEKEMEK